MRSGGWVRGRRRRIAAASVLALVLLAALLVVFHAEDSMAKRGGGARLEWDSTLEDQPAVRFFLYEDVLEDFTAHCEIKDRYAAKGAEALWIEQLVDHPWRTRDPETADLFVIPANFYAAHRGWCRKTPEEFLRTTSRTLEGSDWFHRSGGRDHVILSTFFESWRQIERLPKFRNMIWLSRMSGGWTWHHPKARCAVAVMHNGPPPRPRRDRNATHRHTLFFVGQADARRAYRLRVATIKSLGDVDGGRGDNFVVGTNPGGKVDPEKKFGIPYCESSQSTGCYLAVRLTHKRFMKELTGSRWNLFVGGDDPGSARFAEAASVGVPSIIISPGVESYLSFKDRIPWRNFTVIVDPSSFLAHPKETIGEVLRRYDDDETRDRMVALQDQYSREFLWGHPESRVATNALAEAARECLFSDNQKRFHSYPFALQIYLFVFIMIIILAAIPFGL